MKSDKVSPILFIVLGVSLGLLGFFLLLANPFGWKLPTPTLTKTTDTTTNTKELPKGLAEAPAPRLILPSGEQTYNISGGDEKVSKISKIIYNPLDPKINTTQVITATANSKEPISTVSLTVNTDNDTKTYPLTFTSGTKINGVWTTSFTVTDTYENIYNVSFEIITELGNKSIMPMLIK